MTTIAYDGKVFAGDRQVTGYEMHWNKTTKIRETADGWVGVSGGLRHLEMISAWLAAGGAADAAPKFVTTGEGSDSFDALIVRRDGRVFVLDQYMVLSEISAPAAVGSGQKFAMAAMYCGKSAEEAVKVAAVFDCYTGADVDCVRVV